MSKDEKFKSEFVDHLKSIIPEEVRKLNLIFPEIQTGEIRFNELGIHFFLKYFTTLQKPIFTLGKNTFGLFELTIFAIVGTIKNPINTGIQGTPNCKSSMPNVYRNSGDISDSPGTLKANPTRHNSKLTMIFLLL